MLISKFKVAAKLHLSDALGIVFILAAIYGQWLIVLAVPFVWCLFYLTSWGRPIWAGRPALLVQMLAIPICALPIVAAQYWLKEAVLLVGIAGLIAFMLIQAFAYQDNKDLFMPNHSPDKRRDAD